ncbi:hypothetical protein Tco_1437294 [Tanacetum coccineum]
MLTAAVTCEASSFNNSSQKRSFGKEIIFDFENSAVHSHRGSKQKRKIDPGNMSESAAGTDVKGVFGLAFFTRLSANLNYFSEFSQRPHKEQNVGPDRLASARKRLQENYQEDQNAKKQRTIQVMDIHDIPKPKNNFTAKNKGSATAEGEIGGGPVSAMEGQSQETIDAGNDRWSTRYGGWWLEPSAKRPAHGATTTPWVAFSRLAPPPPAEMVGENAT